MEENRIDAIPLTKSHPMMEIIRVRDQALIELARQGYNAYGRSTNFKNFQGGQMPAWEHLPPAICTAWVEAVREAMLCFVERHLTDDARCFGKAFLKGEPTFTLRAQDQTAPEVVAFWIEKNAATAPAEKLRDAVDDIVAMRSWPNRKAAD